MSDETEDVERFKLPLLVPRLDASGATRLLLVPLRVREAFDWFPVDRNWWLDRGDKESASLRVIDLVTTLPSSSRLLRNGRAQFNEFIKPDVIFVRVPWSVWSLVSGAVLVPRTLIERPSVVVIWGLLTYEFNEVVIKYKNQ